MNPGAEDNRERNTRIDYISQGLQVSCRLLDGSNRDNWNPEYFLFAMSNIMSVPGQMRVRIKIKVLQYRILSVFCKAFFH